MVSLNQGNPGFRSSALFLLIDYPDANIEHTSKLLGHLFASLSSVRVTIFYCWKAYGRILEAGS